MIPKVVVITMWPNYRREGGREGGREGLVRGGGGMEGGREGGREEKVDFVQVFKNVSAFIDCCCGNSLLQEVSENLSL